MKTVSVDAYVNYLIGHLRYGHYEGVITIEDDEFEDFKKNPVQWITNNDYKYDLDFKVDDYEIDCIGDIDEVSWNEIALTGRLPNE